jgi:hypothetical protein
MSATEPDTPPDQRNFEQQSQRATFLAGVRRGSWNIENVTWPTIDLSISAAPRVGAPARYWLRCDFSNFPADAPTATPWDPEANVKLAANKRPKGEFVAVVFRSDWEDGRALYAAYDRVALAGHQNWVTECQRTAWDGTQDLTWWVLRIWELLNDDDYLGIETS